MTTVREQLVTALEEKEFRDLFVGDSISTGIAIQIKSARESRRWTQKQLGEYAGGIAQETVSKLEDPDYGKLTLTTLKRLASALDVALIVRFVPFSDLVDWSVNLSPTRLSPPDFAHDERLQELVSATTVEPWQMLLPPTNLVYLFATEQVTQPAVLARASTGG